MSNENNEAVVKSIDDIIKWIEPNKCFHQFFRGESQKYDYPFSSTLYRYLKGFLKDGCQFIHNFTYSGELNNGNGILKIQKDIINNVKRHFIGYSQSEIISELQHYGGKTVFIDVTKNILIASYFSCCDNVNEDGYLYKTTLPSDAENMRKYYNLTTPIENAICFGIGWRDLNGFLQLHDSTINNRSVFQNSYFLLHSEGFLNSNIYSSIKIDKNSKQQILKDLDEKFGINEISIYGDIHGYIKNQDEIIKNMFVNRVISNKNWISKDNVKEIPKRFFNDSVGKLTKEIKEDVDKDYNA